MPYVMRGRPRDQDGAPHHPDRDRGVVGQAPTPRTPRRTASVGRVAGARERRSNRPCGRTTNSGARSSAGAIAVVTDHEGRTGISLSCCPTARRLTTAPAIWANAPASAVLLSALRAMSCHEGHQQWPRRGHGTHGRPSHGCIRRDIRGYRRAPCNTCHDHETRVPPRHCVPAPVTGILRLS